MRCKFCDSLEELKWPENYKKGDKPISKDTERPHICNTKKPTPEIRNPKKVCHECKARTLNCNEFNCSSCKFTPSFCPTCDCHVSVFDVK
jgi:hypothetical protein